MNIFAVLYAIFPNLRPSVNGALANLNAAIKALEVAAGYHEAQADKHTATAASAKFSAQTHSLEMARALSVKDRLEGLTR